MNFSTDATAPDIYFGVMSGTSLDGIDVVAVDFSTLSPQYLGRYNHSFPKALRQRLLAIASNEPLAIRELGQITTWLSECYAQAITILRQQLALPTHLIQAVGCHGQTVWHEPNQPYPFSIQLNNPSLIAARTGLTTISDFRSKDLAYGGQGAPLVPAFHQALFKNTERIVAVVNIGGIANISLISPDLPLVGYDTGPGNMLLDGWISHCQGLPMDRDGQWASQGTIIPKLLQQLLSDPYFDQTPPKSTGREYFNLSWLTSKLTGNEQPSDVQATLLELTAITICNELTAIKSGDLHVCGGGAHNGALMQALQRHLPHWVVAPTDQYGVSGDAMEAMAFAWLAQQCMLHQPIAMPSISGASQEAILGGIFYAD